MPLTPKEAGTKNLTPKGRLKDGYYYPATCPRCGPTKAAYLAGSRILVCPDCNNEKGVELRREK